MSGIKGVADLGLFRVIGQPNLNYVVDRDAAARYGINVADIQAAIEGAVGGTIAGAPVTQVLDGEARYDVTVALQPAVPPDAERNRQHPPGLAPSGERVSLAQVTQVGVTDGAEEIGREGGSRYVAIKYSVCATGTSVPPSKRPSPKSTRQVQLPTGLQARLGRRVREPEAQLQAASPSSAPSPSSSSS